jgi:ADP-heptose:LPS heptosyltransferase
VFFNLNLKFNKIVIINEVDYIGDSIIFFWPLVNAIADEFPNKEIQVFHPHKNVFKPAHSMVMHKSLVSFYDREDDYLNTVLIAFVKSDGRLKYYLKSQEFSAIVKGMVGLDFSSLNMSDVVFQQNEFEQVEVDKKEMKYSWKKRSVDEKSGFPSFGKYFENVYEYAKSCNETFFGLNNMKMADAQNILASDMSIEDVKANIFSSSKALFNRKFILLNLIAGTFKKDVLEKYDSLLIWIQKLVSNSLKENLDVYILADDNFPKLRTDLATQADNLFFLKEDSLPYWACLIKNAEMVYSIDTGFLHIAYILNINTYGFGGDVDFWFFNDRRIDFFMDKAHPNTMLINH